MAAAPAVTPQVQPISCPNCGGTVKLRGYGQSLSVVCIQCLSVLDLRDERVKVLQTFQVKDRVRPAIPLGSRGTLEGAPWELIGFQVREIEVDEETYAWREYLLFNPYKGYRYLSEYDNHWNRIRAIRELPQPTQVNGRPAVVWLGNTFKHFQTAMAKTTYVMGEFPWEVRVGETVEASDYVAPPRMLSAEKTKDEITWSVGEYTTPAEIWQAFKLPGEPPAPIGVFANQPAPAAAKADQKPASSLWKVWLWLTLLLVVVGFGFYFGAGNRQIFRQKYTYRAPAATPGSAAGATADTGFITPQFDVPGGSGNLEIQIRTDLSNDWAFFGIALINAQTGEPREFGREVGFYSGRDSDGSWSEGDRNEEIAVLDVPAGKYYLRIDPEMENTGSHSVDYEIIVKRDVPTLSFFWLALLLLFLPPLFRGFGRLAASSSFETERWAQSDYGVPG